MIAQLIFTDYIDMYRDLVHWANVVLVNAG